MRVRVHVYKEDIKAEAEMKRVGASLSKVSSGVQGSIMKTVQLAIWACP